MKWSIEGATQEWRCSVCGWNIITTYIDEINTDEEESISKIMNKCK